MSADHRPTVSVLIPAFNSEETIGGTIQSVLGQTIKPDEIIVGCDGCTDKTAEVARSLGAIVIEQPKSNGSVARNTAFAASKGEIVFLLDADDEWLPHKIESHLAAHARSPDASFVVDPVRRVRPNGDHRGLNGAGPDGSMTWQDMVEHRNWTSGSAISVRRSKWEAVGGFNPKLLGLQDVDFLIRSAYFGGPGYRIAESNTLYHLSEGGISRNTSWGDERIAALAASCPFLEKHHILSVRQTIAIRNAIVGDLPAFWAHLRWGQVPISDKRVWKALGLVMLRKFRSLRQSRS